MIRIEQDPYSGYRIFLGDGKRGGYQASNIEEASTAVKHHFGSQDEYCRMGNNPNCPLCRAINEEMKAMKQGKSWRTA